MILCLNLCSENTFAQYLKHGMKISFIGHMIFFAPSHSCRRQKRLSIGFKSLEYLPYHQMEMKSWISSIKLILILSLKKKVRIIVHLMNAIGKKVNSFSSWSIRNLYMLDTTWMLCILKYIYMRKHSWYIVEYPWQDKR